MCDSIFGLEIKLLCSFGKFCLLISLILDLVILIFLTATVSRLRFRESLLVTLLYCRLALINRLNRTLGIYRPIKTLQHLHNDLNGGISKLYCLLGRNQILMLSLSKFSVCNFT